LLDWVWSRFAPQATQTALKRELGKLVPPPIGGDEFQDEFAHMKKNKQRQDEFGSIR
jgi:hypothetical protein